MRNDEASRQKRQAFSHWIPGGCEFRSGVTSATELIFMSESELSCSHLPVSCISWENSVTLSQLPDVKHSLRIHTLLLLLLMMMKVMVMMVIFGPSSQFFSFAHRTGFILRCPEANVICLRQSELKAPPSEVTVNQHRFLTG